MIISCPTWMQSYLILNHLFNITLYINILNIPTISKVDYFKFFIIFNYFYANQSNPSITWVAKKNITITC